jgi:multimeric flavodoxin WrbA
MSNLAIVYHSAHGHTEFIAHQVLAGTAEIEGIDARLVKAEDIARTPDDLVAHDGLIFGSPTYLGGVSGPFKSFMDSTGRLQRTQQLKGRLATGFTVSSLPAGDKQSTLLSMSLLVSGISTYRGVGFGESYAGLCVGAWLTAWLVAFPVVLVVAPLARTAVARLTAES